MAASFSSSSTLSSFALLVALAGCSSEVLIDPARGNGGAATSTQTSSSTDGVGGAISTTTYVGGGATTTVSTSTTTVSTSTTTTPLPCDPATIDHDPHHCGTCNHSCLGGDCVAGACEPLRLHLEWDEPRGLCLYSNDVYWFNGAGTIARVSKQGGYKKTVGGGGTGVNKIRVEDDLVYWSQYMGLSSASSIPIEGGPATGVGYVGPGGGDLALDDTYVYWSLFDTASQHVLMKTPRAGGPMTPVSPAPTRFAGVEVNDGYLYWVDPTSTLDMPVPTEVGGIRRAKANVGPIETVITSHDVSSFVFDQTHVYWVHSGTYGNDGWSGATIRRAPKGGGAEEAIVNLPKDAYAFGIAVDDTNVYWVSYDGHAVNKADKHGGPTIKMADAGNPLAIAVDDVAVYWVDPTLGEVNKVAK